MNKWVVGAVLALVVAGCRESEGGGNGAAANASNASGAAGGTAAAPAGAKRFVNNRNNNVSAKLKEEYVDFSLNYPDGWTEKVSPTAGNFVQLSGPQVDGLEAFSFAVGHASGSGNVELDRNMMQSLLPQLEQQFGSSIQDFEVTERGQRQLGRYAAQGFSFTGKAPGPDGEPVEAAGRVDIILPPGATQGVTAMSLAYDRGEGAPAPDAIAQLEPFRMIHDSLRVGADSR